MADTLHTGKQFVLFCIHDDHANGSRAWITTAATIGAQLNFIN